MTGEMSSRKWGKMALMLRTDIVIGVSSVGKQKRYLKSWSNYFNSLNTEAAIGNLI